MPLHVLGVTRPYSGESAHMLFGVITCIGCVLAACRLQFHRNLHYGYINCFSVHMTRISVDVRLPEKWRKVSSTLRSQENKQSLISHSKSLKRRTLWICFKIVQISLYWTKNTWCVLNVR
jgi:hypothetical protein